VRRASVRSLNACLFAVLAGRVGSPQMAPPATPLSDGAAIERTMAAEDTHRYAIDLRAGEYLQVAVEQRGVDVALTLAAPDGSVVLETDGPAGYIGPDPLAVVAAASGVHELRLKASFARPHGTYSLHVEAMRVPGPADRLRVKAVQDAAEAFRLIGKDTQGQLRRFQDAAAGWQGLGDRRMQMWCELMVGFAYVQGAEQHAEGAAWFQRALTTALELGDEWAEARLRYSLGVTLRNLGKLEEAKSNYERALALHTAAGRDDDAAAVLSSLGNYYSLAGEPQVALDHLREALRRYQAAGNPRGEAIAYSTMGWAYLRLGDFELALESFLSSLPPLERRQTYRSRRVGGTEAIRARAINGMALAHFWLGDVDRARAAYAEALALYQKTGNRITEADALGSLADLHRHEGELEKAQELYEASLVAYRERANPAGEAAALCKLGDVHRRGGRLDAAREAFEAAEALADRAGAVYRGCAEQGRARLLSQARRFPEALALAEAALVRLESARGRLAGQGSRAAALAYQQSAYELAMDIRMQMHAADPTHGHEAAAFEISERGRARALLELLGEGRLDIRRGVDPELLARERSLRQGLNATAATQAEAVAAGRKDRAEALARELDHLSGRLAEAESVIRRASPAYAALTQAQPLTLAEIRARVLGPDTQLLQYALGEERSYAWVVSASGIAGFALASRAEIEAAARALHARTSEVPGATNDGPLQEAAQRMSRLVLEPVAAALSAKRLLVVAPGALQYVPLAALPLSDGRPLLARFELVSAPSASVIDTIRAMTRDRPAARGGVAVFADAVFDATDPRIVAATPREPKDAPTSDAIASADRVLRVLRGHGRDGRLGRLPFSRREAEAIAGLAPRGQVRVATGFEANREAVVDPRLADERIVHFATHAVLNTRRAELSGVVLSLYHPDGRRRDGFLRTHDVYDLRLQADLVVLSGCQTGLGKQLEGEGLVGLTRGFLFAGARAVVASLWPVDDESTAELMARFYRGLLKEGRPPAAALRAAQLEMSGTHRWSAPFHWAGFVVQGDWRSR
jgi:CHAT domain-containing protein